MEKMKKILLAVICSVLTNFGAAASGTWVVNSDGDTIWYKFNEEKKTASVTFNRGYAGSISIPEEVTYNGKKYRVTTIGIYAFEGCKGLTSVAIPKSVKAIGEGAFERCYGLASVTIPSSVTVIGPTAFYLCTGLTSVTIPSSVTTIGTWAFSFCDKLEKIDVEKGNSNYSSENGVLFDASKKTLVRCPGGIKGEYIIPKGVTAIEKSAFLGCTGLTSVSIPKSVTTIGESAFADCTGLTSVSIPKSVTTIGMAAFSGCFGLTSVTIPKRVTTIGYMAFSSCTGLTSVTIPNGVTTIGDSAFYNCSGLTSVTIPKSVTTIGKNAFRGCNGLASVTILNSTPPSIKGYFIYGVSRNIPLYVPAESVEKYKAAKGWSEFKNIKAIPAK